MLSRCSEVEDGRARRARTEPSADRIGSDTRRLDVAREHKPLQVMSASVSNCVNLDARVVEHRASCFGESHEDGRLDNQMRDGARRLRCGSALT